MYFDHRRSPNNKHPYWLRDSSVSQDNQRRLEHGFQRQVDYVRRDGYYRFRNIETVKKAATILAPYSAGWLNFEELNQLGYNPHYNDETSTKFLVCEDWYAITPMPLVRLGYMRELRFVDRNDAVIFKLTYNR